jgi:hypothetical protein
VVIDKDNRIVRIVHAFTPLPATTNTPDRRIG